ncbi:DUF547 domain-containing protein [Hymenobacter sp. ASUV-10]|uniref:DUF547 domain-containing protein n=1 Tax=Hymenobacter aranciens TaxID=3063996 RepID=A0ABT9BDN0_9BACT|nr:DUF547 domain-containing protein [Hymenobacter sp. ASUV-10]MDO7875890.1 DUF547 domain-containing protein [Hymenobacter sp. ASUV-10]
MKKFLLPRRWWVPTALLGALLLAAPLLALKPHAPPTPNLAAATTAYFKKFVDAEGNVNYAAIKRNPLELQALLRRIETFDAAAATENDRKAFYLNAYNVLVIGEVVARYPLESVQKVPGFFDKNTVSVAGDKLTLNDLETKKIREPYADPRTHFALVCGAKGCPRLNREAYVGNLLDAQLTVQARRVLQDPAFVRVDAAAKKVHLSEIFKWYEADFKASGKTGVAYVNQFREGKLIPAGYAVSYYPYDWKLNDVKR